jgi:predicted ester cyclase
MSPDDISAVLHRYVGATNAREPIDWYFGPGYRYQGPLGDLGRDALVQQHDRFLAAFPDVNLSILDIVVEGDKAATRWSARGTHQGELMGISPTRRAVTITGIIITRFANGKAVDEVEEINMLGLMQQLGVAPAPSSPR